MTPLLLIAGGLIALATGAAILRSFGSGYRIGRLLATTPQVTVDEALQIADEHAARYVRVDGRIDSETDFEDEFHRPLVFRRKRMEARQSGRWQVLHDGREAVPFEIHEGLGAIEVDHEALDAGLVVIPREALGVADDAREYLETDLPPGTPVRLRIEQVSSVEHAVVLGVPVRNGTGPAKLTSGAGKPLILTTLEVPEAMRLLSGGDKLRARFAAALLALGLVLLAAGVGWTLFAVVTPQTALAADPSPTPLLGGDPRSAGEGPGFVGAPLLAILAVLALGIVTAVITTLYVRFTEPRGGRRRPTQ